MSDDGEFRHPSHAVLAAQAPEFFAQYDTVVRNALALDGDEGLALPQRYRELIVICMLALLRAPEDSIADHIDRAIGAGLTEAELLEGLQAAFVPGGAPVLMHGVRSLVRHRERSAEGGTR